MSTEQSVAFSAALKGYRLARGLTQEVIAERAGVSARTVQALERGQNVPHRETAERLAAALGLQAEERQHFVAAAVPVPRRRLTAHPATPAAAVAVLGTTDDVPARREDSSPHNLPLHLTSFVGRASQMAEIADLLEGARLLTLTGTGGVGKTRLAQQLARHLLERYPQGVWLVELAALSDGPAVPRALAATLGVREEAGRPLMTTVIGALRARQLLLVLDNCEHLIGACAALADALLQACPQLCILATSRAALGITGEIAWRVPSLALPAAAPDLPLELLAQSEAVRLFRDRAVAAQPQFALTAENAAVVAHVCQRLDGIPLALELAAARVPVLGVDQLSRRLDDRFRLLTGGSRTAPPRHQTLRATVEWSYSLLRPPEQALFAQLAVFAGGFTLEAAEAVCAGGAITPEDVLDLLARLVEQSVVLAEEDAAGGIRYRLLETLRQYARERLEAGDAASAAAVRGRHAAYYLALAEEGEAGLQGPAQLTWLDRLEREHENLRAATRWLVAQGEAERAAGLAGALLFFWEVRGWRRAGRDLLETVLGAPGAAPTAARAKALWAAGLLAHFDGDDGLAGTVLEESLAIARALEQPRVTGTALMALGWYTVGWSDTVAGRRLLEEALATQRAAGDAWGSAWTLTMLAAAATHEGDAAAARARHDEALAIRRALGDEQGQAFTLQALAGLCWAQGDLDAAVALLEEGPAIQRRVGDRPTARWSQYFLGLIAAGRGDAAAARAHLTAMLALSQALGDGETMALALLTEIVALRASTRPAEALRLATAATAHRERLSRALNPADQVRWESRLEALRATLGDDVAAAAWADGQSLTLEQASAEALRSAADGATEGFVGL